MGALQVLGGLWRLVVVFVACIGMSYVLFSRLLERHPSLADTLSWNLSFEDIQRGDVSAALRSAMAEDFELTVLCFASVFFIKQTFAIPGSALLNVIAGVLLPIHFAFPLVCFLTMCGASSCYILSSTLGSHESLVSMTDYFLPGKLDILQAQIDAARNEQRLMFVLLFLRIFPFSPNWLLNMASPYLNIPLFLFAPSVFFGLMPYNYVTVKAGSMLSNLQGIRDIFDLQTVLGFLTLAALMLVPAVVKRANCAAKKSQ
ncbi:hypothetical protein H310_02373 [Aphanomyces invadans]|uniref:VTT domain-containing protein n=2 Tax=Aphanomyces invadans TaxID=157072 RepID=A0A024UQV7_9STRA|nr:hypothetical protein H310_02373 [Aphanomyces invadans]ETW07988.1 hypothetical protein H310_02373 [Aphanomyces invadans]|eukprot:XP_008864081.1 hypothetical protein H310_02373 [Aphanomyces invadans]